MSTATAKMPAPRTVNGIDLDALGQVVREIERDPSATAKAAIATSSRFQDGATISLPRSGSESHREPPQ